MSPPQHTSSPRLGKLVRGFSGKGAVTVQKDRGRIWSWGSRQDGQDEEQKREEV